MSVATLARKSFVVAFGPVDVPPNTTATFDAHGVCGYTCERLVIPSSQGPYFDVQGLTVDDVPLWTPMRTRAALEFSELASPRPLDSVPCKHDGALIHLIVTNRTNKPRKFSAAIIPRDTGQLGATRGRVAN